MRVSSGDEGNPVHDMKSTTWTLWRGSTATRVPSFRACLRAVANAGFLRRRRKPRSAEKNDDVDPLARQHRSELLVSLSDTGPTSESGEARAK